MKRLGLLLVMVAGAWAQAVPTIAQMQTAGAFGGYANTGSSAGWLEIYGTGLATTTRSWATADFNGANAPTTLDGVSVSVNGSPAFVSYVSPTQLNVQLPNNVPATGTVPVIVTVRGQASAAASFTANGLKPGLLAPASFAVNGRQYVAALHASNNAFVANDSIAGVTSAPAIPGETLVIYGVGFGPVTPNNPAGRTASGQTAINATVGMTIGGQTATLNYAGLAPGAVGLYQFNVVVPNGLSVGDQKLELSLNGAVSTLQTLYVPVGAAAVPGAPRNVSATPGTGSATVAFQAPASDGGAAVNRYSVICRSSSGNVTANGPRSPIAVNGLTNGVTYACAVTATNSVGTGPESASASVTPVAGGTGFTLTSSVANEGGTLPADYTCDGMGSTLPLAWQNAPAGTKEFAVLMTTLPGDGTTKWNWVLYNIPATTSSLPRDTFLLGTRGVGSDGPGQVYNPPCSQGPGAKVYTFTVYALSGTPTFSAPANQVNGQMVTDAISSLTLAKASLNLNSTRPTNPPGSSTGCGYVLSSTRASRSGNAVVTCDATYAYVGSNGITTQPMMNGITSTNLQVPIPVNFNGTNAWKIPLNPKIAATTTNVVDGPIGVAINGVPIFNPCTQGGCVTGGDTKALGQLDTCNGHAGRADDYHYHAAPICMMADQPSNYWDTHPLGWALDGFAIFGYRDADGTTAARDNICGGNTKTVPNAPAGYAYHVTDASPYFMSCLVGTPSPDLPGQGAKYRPMRQPPVTPFNVTNMTLTTDASDGYQVLQFTSAIRFTTNETGSDSYVNQPGTYKIRYKQVTGAALVDLLAQRQNANATTCWNFQFVDASGNTTQPSISYCK